MTKRLLIVLTLCMLILTGCITLQYPGTGGDTSGEVIVVTATPLPQSQEQQVIYITATPDTAATNAAATSAATTIKITSIVDNGNGLATVYWESTGDFPVGFELVWSDSHQTPTFPEDPSVYIGDPSKRSAQIQGDIKKTYYVRICRYVSNSCDIYSDVGVIKFAKPTATVTRTMAPTNTSAYMPPPPVYYPTSTPYSGAPYIKITSITYAGSGSANITWTAYGSFPKGFLILYAIGTTVPTYGDFSYFKVANGTTRSYTVSGTNGKTYTFVICRWTGTSCDLNSNAYVYKFTSATPTRTPVGAYPLP
jgi:hypothetical protein